MSDRYTGGKKRRRNSQRSSSTAELYEKGPPGTSGHSHRASGKLKKGQTLRDVNYDFREKKFSEATDSLGYVGLIEPRVAMPAKLQDRLQMLRERAQTMQSSSKPNDKKIKKGKYREEPLDIVRREQKASCINLFDSQYEREGSDFHDNDIHKVPEKALHARQRQPDSPDNSTKQVRAFTDSYKIPRKLSSSALEHTTPVSEEKERNQVAAKPPSSCSTSPDDNIADIKRSSLRPSVNSTTIDLCADGETDSEDYNGGNNSDRSPKGDEAFSKKSRDVNRPAKHFDEAADNAKKEEQKIAQAIATIENDQPFVPQPLFTLSKAPSSSEGRKIKEFVALSDKTADEKRESPVRSVINFVKNSMFGKKKSANAGQPIVPGASLESNKTRTARGTSLESNKARTARGASQEASKTITASVASMTTPSKHRLSCDSSDESYDTPARPRSGEKPVTKKTSMGYKKDDSLPARSSARKNSRTPDREVPTASYATRSSTRKTSIARKIPEVVDMLEDSEDEQNTLACFDIARIALGSSVKHQNCQIRVFSDGILSFSYSIGFKERTHSIDFASTEVEKVCYFIDNTVDVTGRQTNGDTDIEPGSFIALKAQKTKSNGLSSVNSYVPGDSNEEKGFVVAEFRSDADIATFMRVVQENKFLSPFFSKESRLKCHNVDLYSKALVADAKKEALSRNKKVKSSKRVGFLAGKASDDLLLRFPFGENPRLIDAAAKDLSEFEGFCCTDTNEDEAGLELYKDVLSQIGPVEGDTRRRHHVEIRVEDFDRLEPGVYLNDTLIDFFLQWMTRKYTSPDLHIFTTHFYTTLEDKGVEAVSSWTAKKKIDVFKLKFVYIPINKSLHWSFCVVVNPGCILSHLAREEGHISGGDAPMPCLLFFDSLKMHQKDRVHRNVIKWLNAEWLRLGKSSDERAPFDRSSLAVLTPKVTFQKNSWDCGVFVCRYASGMFQLRDRDFSYNELLGGKGDVIEMISDGPEFNFSLDHIAVLRDQMKTLIERLSTIYLPWRAKMDQEERSEKLAENTAKSEHKGSSLESGNSVQSLRTPHSSTDEHADMPSHVHDKGDCPDSPGSLATQHDFNAFDNRTTKENIGSDFKISRKSEMLYCTTDSRQRWVDTSPSHSRHTGDEPRFSLSNHNSTDFDTASV